MTRRETGVGKNQSTHGKFPEGKAEASPNEMSFREGHAV